MRRTGGKSSGLLVLHTYELHLQPRPLATTDRESEDPEHHPELRREEDEDERLPQRVEDADPEDGEVEVRQEGEPVSRPSLVASDEDERSPREPEEEDEDEGHDVARVGEVLAEGGRVLFVVDGRSAPHPPHHREDVRVGVDDGDDGGSEDEDGQGGRVGGHVPPVEEADEGVTVEPRLVEPQQRGTAHHRSGDPSERHPALASDLGLNRVVPTDKHQLY